MTDFRGNLDDKEVEITLEKFLEILNENLTLKERLLDVNPFRKWIHMARAIDSYRVFPRIFIGAYIALLIFSSIWFMGLVDPTGAQSAFVGTIIGAGAAWFGLYVNSGWTHNNPGK